MKHRSQISFGTGLGVVALAFVAAAALTGCKDPGKGPRPEPSKTPVAGRPTTSDLPPSPTASATASKSVTKAPTSTSKPAGNPPHTVAGFPAAHNTGYPHGLPGDTRKPVTLTRYTGPMTITTSGTVIDSKDIAGTLTIKAKNVVVKNSRIRAANAAAIASTDDQANLVIQDTEIDGQGLDASTGGIALIARTGYTLLRVNAHSSGDIVRMDGRATIQDSWLHNPSGKLGSQHNDVIQSTNATYIRILHNRLENQHTQTACILLKADLGSISDVVVDSNLMNGAGYSFYWYDAAYRATNAKVTNNRFMRSSGGGFFPKGGYWGTHAIKAGQPPQWSGNVWNDTGQVINM